MMALPPWLRAGVTVTVRLAPVPPNTIFAFGTTPGFEDEPVRMRASAGMSGSLMVKLIGPGELLLFTSTSSIGEMVGGTIPVIHSASVWTALVSIVLPANGGL